MALTGFDYLILLIMAFFTLLGLIRGFIGELSSLINWIGSSIITIFLQPSLNSIIYEKVHNSTLSNFLSGSIIFTISIIMLSIITTKLDNKINTKFPYSVNITLGTFFGFIKGFLISSMIFLIILKLFGDTPDINKKTGPEWIKNSKTYNILTFGLYIISPFTDSFFDKMKQEYIIPEKNKDNNKMKIEEKTNDVNDLKKIRNIKDIDKEGYKKEQIKRLSRLIEIL